MAAQGHQAGRSPSLPDFFIIGAPKCGTTTLYEMLRGHPQLAIPRKEPGWMSQDVEDTSASRGHFASRAAYEALYAGYAPGVLTGEATPRTLYSQAAFDLIRAERPEARLIAVLRDPVDLAFSFHAQKLREGRETESDFEAAWRRGVNAKTGKPLSASARIDGAINYSFYARFGCHLEKWRSRFGEDQLLVLTLDDLKDSAVVYAKLLAHLDVADDGRRGFAVANQRVELKHPGLHRLVVRTARRLQPVMAPLRQLNGGAFGITKAVNRLNTRRQPLSSGVSVDFRAFMMHAIADDCRLAEQLCERPIARQATAGTAEVSAQSA